MKEIGLTYPKRAKGLVKKGRALYVNDCDIRLEVSDVNNNITEETQMDNINNNNVILDTETGEVKTISPQDDSVNSGIDTSAYNIYLKVRDWKFNPDCQRSNKGNRSFMTAPDGKLSEAFTIGCWVNSWTEILSKTLVLPKNSLCYFTFWLNGGENDRNDEVCRLDILFNNDWDNRLSYNLNRDFILPEKICGGWELYRIPFRTGDNEYTQLRFVANNAYMTVMDTEDISVYADLPESRDEFEGIRPQRHNVIFGEDGFPRDTWYSTAKLRTKNASGQKSESEDGRRNSSGNSGKKNVRYTTDSFSGMLDRLEDIADSFQNMVDNLESRIDELEGRIDDLDDQMEDRIDNLNDQLDDKLDNFDDKLERFDDRLEELADRME